MSTQKSWDRPWSMEEIIENSDKWNLAGDVALLNNLKTFADKLISKTSEINNDLNNLTNKLDETHLQLNIAQNEFQSLRNSQFIESRVYEDDETLPPSDGGEKVEEESEPDRIEEIRLAAVRGLKVLDEYFEKIDVSVSDSEDEDIDLPNYILRSKDLYIDRPLPYVIGSEDWHKSWHVGLENSSSDSETEKVSDKFSESDSESDLPIIQDRSQIKSTSDTSSELDFSHKIETNKSISSKDLFQSSDSEDQNSVPVQAPISNKNFAEELAAKLGNVVKQGYEEPEINHRPIQRKPQYGDLFFDEPPPLEEPKGLFSGGSGLFDDDDDDDDMRYSTPIESRIEESPKSLKKTEPGLFDKENSDIFSTKKPTPSDKPPLLSEEPPVLEEKKKPVGGVSIFGGKDLFNKKLLKHQPSSSDEEIERKKEKKISNKKIDLFMDDDDDLFKSANESKTTSRNVASKKVNLFDSDEDKSVKSNLFSDDEVSPRKHSDGDASRFLSDKSSLKPETAPPQEVKKISLFDDDEDLFRDDLFSSSNTKNKLTLGLFDDVNVENDLFSNESNNKPKPTKNLFEDLMNIPDDQNSINVNRKNETVNTEKSKSEIRVESGGTSKVSPTSSDVLGDISISKEPLFGDFENDRPMFSTSERPQPKPRLSLFDSPPPETDDLFSVESRTEHKPSEDENIFKDLATSSQVSDFSVEKDIKVKTNIFDSPTGENSDNLFDDKSFNCDNIFSSPTVHSSKDIFGDVEPKEQRKPVDNVPSMRLFDSVPPPDDEWETKSENISDDNQSYTDQEEGVGQETNLFSEEPPSLDIPSTTNVSSKVLSIAEKLTNEPKDEVKPQNVTSPGKLRHSLNINVNALMPGSLPPRRGELQQTPSVEKSEEQGSFDTTDNVEVLHSITKDRVKVPLHRRPSTRRCRKAALRTTSSDFKLDEDEDIKVESTTSSKDEVPTPNRSPILKSPTTNDDLFESKPSKFASKSDLFGDDDDDDDMFSSKKVPVHQTKPLKKSLFDDDDTDDDDDIFKSVTETRVRDPRIKVATEKKIAKVSSVKKLENTKVDDDDPLSALLK